jgi:hypothetical protein
MLKHDKRDDFVEDIENIPFFDLNDPRFTKEEIVQYLVDGGFSHRQAMMLVYPPRRPRVSPSNPSNRHRIS